MTAHPILSPVMTSPKVLDLDAELGFGAADDEPQHLKSINIVGIDVRVVCDLNSFGLTNVTSGEGTSADVMKFLESMIHPDDWPAFRSAASKHPAFRGEAGAENLMKMITRITEVAAERPTQRPSASVRGASTRSIAPRSPAKSGSGRAKVSKTSR